MRYGLAGDRGLRHQRATGAADGFDTELNQKRVDLRLEREVFALGGLLDHIDGHKRHFLICYLQGARRLPWASIFQKPVRARPSQSEFFDPVTAYAASRASTMPSSWPTLCLLLSRGRLLKRHRSGLARAEAAGCIGGHDQRPDSASIGCPVPDATCPVFIFGASTARENGWNGYQGATGPVQHQDESVSTIVLAGD